MDVYEDQWKCLHCSLHFATFSDRTPKRNGLDVHCPECGQKGTAFLLQKNTHKDTYVFRFIPRRAA